jgi:hypothetical protein
MRYLVSLQSIIFRTEPNLFHPGYDPSKAAAAVAGGLYSIASLCLFTRLFMNKAWWGLCLPIASTRKFLRSTSKYVLTVKQ